MYNNCQFKRENRYIEVLNATSPNTLVRYVGVYHTPNMAVPYTTVSFGAGIKYKFSFPADTTITSITIQIYNATTSAWKGIFTTVCSFPGVYCYKITGNLASPQVTQIPCSSQNYIDVYNNTSPSVLIRYLGRYHTPSIDSLYRTLSFGSNDHCRSKFPMDTTNASLVIQLYNSVTGNWKDIFNIPSLLFPGGYCYRVTGNFSSPQVNEIPCPSQNNLTNNICCNNVIP